MIRDIVLLVLIQSNNSKFEKSNQIIRVRFWVKSQIQIVRSQTESKFIEVFELEYNLEL